MSEEKKLVVPDPVGKVIWALISALVVSAVYFFIDYIVTEPEFQPVQTDTQELKSIVKQNSIAIQQQVEFNNYSAIRNATRDIDLLGTRPEEELSSADKIRLEAAKEQLRTRGINP